MRSESAAPRASSASAEGGGGAATGTRGAEVFGVSETDRTPHHTPPATTSAARIPMATGTVRFAGGFWAR